MVKKHSEEMYIMPFVNVNVESKSSEITIDQSLFKLATQKDIYCLIKDGDEFLSGTHTIQKILMLKFQKYQMLLIHFMLS